MNKESNLAYQLLVSVTCGAGDPATLEPLRNDVSAAGAERGNDVSEPATACLIIRVSSHAQ